MTFVQHTITAATQKLAVSLFLFTLPLAAQQLPLGQVVATHVFNGPTDSPDPQFGLIELANGNFAGVTQGNAQNRQSTRMIYEMTPGGVVTPLITFGPKRYQLTSKLAFGYEGTFSLIQASDGNFYGVTSKSGANSFGNIYRLTPSGEYTVLYVFDTPPLGGLAEGLDAGLYGIGFNGSAFAVYRIDLASGAFAFLYTGPAVFEGTPVFGDRRQLYNIEPIARWPDCGECIQPEHVDIGCIGDLHQSADNVRNL